MVGTVLALIALAWLALLTFEYARFRRQRNRARTEDLKRTLANYGRSVVDGNLVETREAA